MGRNNSGKTSILQAIQLLSDIVVYAFGNRDRPDFGSPRWSSDPSMAIQRVSFSDPDAVWLHKKTAEPCRLVATFSDDVEARLDVNGRNRYSLDLLRNGESIKKGFVEPEAQAVVEELFSLRVVYVPPIGSLSPAENFSNWHNVKMGIDQGAISQYWRRYLYWLYNDGGKDAFDRVLNMVTEYLPGVKVLPPRLTHSDPPAVEIQFEEEGTSLDISGSGGGLRTILNLASILTFSRSKSILFGPIIAGGRQRVLRPLPERVEGALGTGGGARSGARGAVCGLWPGPHRGEKCPVG